MRTPRLYADTIGHATDEVSLSERNHHYLSRVLRAKPGQIIRLFDGRGRTCEATVKEIRKRETTIELMAITESPDHRLPVTLGLALIKSDRLDWALQKATELGVSAIQPIITQFTDSPPKADRLEKKWDHWKEILVNACEQSDNDWVPVLREPRQLDELALPGQTIVAHPATDSVQINPDHEALLLIGPEGGFSDAELDFLYKKQVKPMSLGPRILRTETAAIVGLTLLGQQYGQY